MCFSEIFYFIFCFLITFLGTYLVLPQIVAISNAKRLINNPNLRSSHYNATPNLGGVAFFMSFVLGLYLLDEYDVNRKSMVLVFGLLILFMTGLKDDLLSIKPLTKLVAQIVASIPVIINPFYQIKNLHGFLGIYEVYPVFSIALTALLLVFLINSFNLIDGIDGLAGMVGIVAFSILGMFYLMMDKYFYFGICVIGTGTLFGFLPYNLSKGRNKIFMGDTGSMILGFLLTVLTLRLFNFDSEKLAQLPFNVENLPLVLVAILIVPFFDTTRIILVRFVRKKRIFYPDRNHIHHLLIDYLKLSHGKASLYICITNFLLVLYILAMGYYFQSGTVLLIMMLVIISLIVFFFIIDESPLGRYRKRKLKRKITQFKRKASFNF